MRQTPLPFVCLAQNRFHGVRVCEMDDAERHSVIDLALEVLAELHRPGQALGSPGDTRRFLQLQLADRKAEVFGAVFLDTRNRVIELEELFHGTIDGASVHPRVVVQRSLEVNAAAAIIELSRGSKMVEAYGNCMTPSGDTTLSQVARLCARAVS